MNRNDPHGERVTVGKVSGKDYGPLIQAMTKAKIALNARQHLDAAGYARMMKPIWRVLGKEIVGAGLKMPAPDTLDDSLEPSTRPPPCSGVDQIDFPEAGPSNHAQSAMKTADSHSHRRSSSTASHTSLAPTEISTPDTPMQAGKKRLASRQITRSTVSMGAPRRKPPATTVSSRESVVTPIKFNGELGSVRSLALHPSSSGGGQSMSGKTKKNGKKI